MLYFNLLVIWLVDFHVYFEFSFKKSTLKGLIRKKRHIDRKLWVVGRRLLCLLAPKGLQNNYFVEYMNNWLNQNNYFVEYINNSLNKNSSFVERIKLFRWILQHLINHRSRLHNKFLWKQINLRLHITTTKCLCKLITWNQKRLFHKSRHENC